MSIIDGLELDELYAQIAALKQQLLGLQSARDAKDKEIARLQWQCTAISDAYRATVDRNAELEAEIKSREWSFDGTDGDGAELEAEIGRLRDEIAQLGLSNAALKAECRGRAEIEDRLRAEIVELKAERANGEIVTLRHIAALEFYAEPENYQSMWGIPKVYNDAGAIARKALEGVRADEADASGVQTSRPCKALEDGK